MIEIQSPPLQDSVPYNQRTKFSMIKMEVTKHLAKHPGQ